MLSHKLDFSSCAWKPGFVKSSHIYTNHCKTFLVPNKLKDVAPVQQQEHDVDNQGT